MNTEDLIRHLKNIGDEYKNKKLHTGELDISGMARSCVIKIQELTLELNSKDKQIELMTESMKINFKILNSPLTMTNKEIIQYFVNLVKDSD